MQPQPPDARAVGATVQKGKPRIVSDAGGRIPAFVPTQEQRNAVMVLAANATPHNIIAEALGISPPTLSKYFRADIDNGRAHIEARIGSTVVKEALAGNMAAARMWLFAWGNPAWKAAKEANPAHNPQSDDGAVVKFYMPSNGRDKPDPNDGPIIEGTGTEG